MIPGSGRSPEEGNGLEKSHGQRNLASYSPEGHKESDVTEQLNYHHRSISIKSNMSLADQRKVELKDLVLVYRTINDLPSRSVNFIFLLTTNDNIALLV